MTLSTTNIEYLSSLSQILQFIVVVIALIYAKSQSDESSKARQLEAFNLLVKQIGDDDIRDIRRWLLNNDIDMNSLTSEEINSLLKLAVAYDRIGFMIKQSYLPDKALYLWQKHEIIGIWNRLEPLIYNIRIEKKRNQYCDYLEYLATDWIQQMENKERSIFFKRNF